MNNTIEGGCSADAWSDPKPKGEFFQGDRSPGEVPVAMTLPDNIDYRFLLNGEFFWRYQQEDFRIRGQVFCTSSCGIVCS